MRDLVASIPGWIVTGAFFGWIIPAVPVMLVGAALGFPVSEDVFFPWWPVCIGVWTVLGIAGTVAWDRRDAHRSREGG